ncbi:MAG: lysylphosphatidylglycerol synthase transmembrane domain-containing protein [Candidatus Thorarchaeota archaeon]
MKKKLPIFFKFLISAILIFFLLKQIELNELYKALTKINILFFVAGIFISILSVSLRAYKWLLLLIPHGKRFSILYLISINFISLFFNNFFLGSLGGDFYKVYMTGDKLESRSDSASSVIMDRITGLFMLALVAPVSGIIIFFMEKSLIRTDHIVIIIFSSLGLCFAIYIGVKIFFKTADFKIVKKFPKISLIAKRMAESIKLYKNHPSIVFASLSLALAYIIFNSLSMYLYTLAAYENIDFILLLFIIIIVTFLIMIPISANGIGVQEGAFIFYFTKLGIDPTTAVLIALLPRIGMIILSLIGAMLYLIKGKTKSTNILIQHEME